MQSRNRGQGVSPRNGHPSSHTPIQTKRSTPGSRALPLSQNETIRERPNRQLGRNKTIRSWDRPLNRETLSDRPTPLTVPQPATNHPEHTIERGDHDSQTSPEENNARIDDEPLHHEAHGARAGMTTTGKTVPGAHTARVVERARKRNAIAERHLQSNLSHRMSGLVCHYWPLLHRLTQRQYRSPPARTQSRQQSPHPR